MKTDKLPANAIFLFISLVSFVLLIGFFIYKMESFQIIVVENNEENYSYPQISNKHEVYSQKEPTITMIENSYSNNSASALSSLISSDKLPAIVLDQIKKGGIDDFNKVEIEALITAIIEAHIQGNDVLKDELLQVLATVQSFESAKRIIEILLGRFSRNTDLGDLPSDIFYAIGKSIRYIPDKLRVGSFIFQLYQKSDNETKERLLEINHPVSNMLLAIDANNAESYKEAQQYLTSIYEVLGYSEMVDTLMLFAKQTNIAPTNEIAELFMAWNRENPISGINSMLIQLISEHNADPLERGLSAYALSAFANDDTRKALEKALDYEENPIVREYIQAALDKNLSKSN